MTHSISTAIDKELKTLILNTANNDHAPMRGVVSSVSDDGTYIDVTLTRGGTLPAVKVFSGAAKIGADVILIFIDGDINDPLALVSDVVPHKPFYNLFFNGNFGITNTNGFDNWTGGSISSESFYGDVGCEIEVSNSLTSNLFDISSIENEAFTVSYVWKGGGFTLEVLDKNGTPIKAVPSPLGNKQQMGKVDNWSFQRYNYLVGDNKKIKIRFVNNDNENTLIDGVRVWKPDDYQEWFPSINDRI